MLAESVVPEILLIFVCLLLTTEFKFSKRKTSRVTVSSSLLLLLVVAMKKSQLGAKTHQRPSKASVEETVVKGVGKEFSSDVSNVGK